MQQQFELACRIIGLVLVLYGVYTLLGILLLLVLASAPPAFLLTFLTQSLIVFTGTALLRSPAPVVRFAYGGVSRPSRPIRRPANRVSTDVDEA